MTQGIYTYMQVINDRWPSWESNLTTTTALPCLAAHLGVAKSGVGGGCFDKARKTEIVIVDLVGWPDWRHLQRLLGRDCTY